MDITDEQKEQILREIPDDQKEIVQEILKRKGGSGVLYFPPPPPGKKCPKYRFHHENEEEGKSVVTMISTCTDKERLKFCDPSKITKEGKLKCSGITVEQVKAKMKEREEALEQYSEMKQRMESLIQRDEVIVNHAKQLEEENKKLRTEVEDYKALTEERLNKLASLVKQLMA